MAILWGELTCVTSRATLAPQHTQVDEKCGPVGCNLAPLWRTLSSRRLALDALTRQRAQTDMPTTLILATRAATLALANLILVQIVDAGLLDEQQRGWLVVGLLDAGFGVTSSTAPTPSATITASKTTTPALSLRATATEHVASATLDPTDGAVMLLELGHRAVSLVDQIDPAPVDVPGPRIALVLERRNASERATEIYYSLASTLTARGAVLTPSDAATHHVCIYSHGFAVSLHERAPATDCSGDDGEALATSEGTEPGAWVAELATSIIDRSARGIPPEQSDTEQPPSVAPPASPPPEKLRVASASLGGLAGWRGALDRAVSADGTWWLSNTLGLGLAARWTWTPETDEVSIRESSAMVSATHALPLAERLELRSSLRLGAWRHHYEILGVDDTRLDPSASIDLGLLFSLSDILCVGAHVRPTWIRRSITHELDGQEVWRRSPWQINAGLSVSVDLWRAPRK